MSRRLRNSWVRFPLHGSLVLAAITLIACRGATEPTAPPPEPPVGPPPVGPPVGLSISPSGLNLIVGDVERLTARAYDSAGQTTNSSFEWSSGDPAIATVGRSDGRVTAISAGSTTVIAAVGALRATATVSVADYVSAIAFTRQTYLTFDVLAFSLTDQALRSLPRPAQFPSIAAPAWSPDGTRLAVEVVHAALDRGEDGIDYTSDLYILDAGAPADSPWRALTANGRSRSPNWSPDGARIAYVGPSILANGNHIYVVDARGGEPVRLTRTEGFYNRPGWSPDGTRLVFSALSDGLVGNGEVFIVNADGSGLSNLTQSAAFDADPSWSPDGSRVAFVSDRDNPDGTYRRAVFVVDVDGSNLRRLTNDLSGDWSASSGPVWSPDGRQIIFSLGAPDNRSGIYMMNADGSSLVRLTTPPPNSHDHAPAWKR